MKRENVPQKNETVDLLIEDLGKAGEGIGHFRGYTLFVKDAVPGDRIRAVVTKTGKNFGYAHLQKIISPSKDRVDPPCPVARSCGGCQLMAMSYPAQLAFKQSLVENALRRIGGFSVLSGTDAPGTGNGAEIRVEEIVPAQEPLRYRNKAQYPVGMRDGKIISGFYAQRSHRIVEADDCMLVPEYFRDILDKVLSLMEMYGIEPYDEETGKGLVRHLLIREGKAAGSVHVCIVVNGEFLPHAEEIAATLIGRARKADTYGDDSATGRSAAVSRVEGVSISVNTKPGNVILGDRLVTISGKPYTEDVLCGVPFRISPHSFYQVNHDQTETLYGLVREFAGLTGTEHVWDLYCGIGTIGLSLASSAGRVTGIEVVPEAVEDARANAARHGIRNAEYYAGAAEEVLPALLAGDPSAAGSFSESDVVIVDPPRKGCAPSLLETIISLQPSKIVYVSCDPATLARDLRILADGGYRIRRVRPVDCFPMTVHVETVVLLRGERVDGHIQVDLDIEELEDKSGISF